MVCVFYSTREADLSGAVESQREEKGGGGECKSWTRILKSVFSLTELVLIHFIRFLKACYEFNLSNILMTKIIHAPCWKPKSIKKNKIAHNQITWSYPFNIFNSGEFSLSVYISSNQQK